MNSIALDAAAERKRMCVFLYKRHGRNMTNEERRYMADIYMDYDMDYKRALNPNYDCSNDTDIPEWCKNPSQYIEPQ